jgi:hypothetical protein
LFDFYEQRRKNTIKQTPKIAASLFTLAGGEETSFVELLFACVELADVFVIVVVVVVVAVALLIELNGGKIVGGGGPVGPARSDAGGN